MPASPDAILAVAAEHKAHQEATRAATLRQVMATWAALEASSAVRSWIGGIGARVFTLIAVGQEQAAAEASAYIARALAGQEVTIEAPTLQPRVFAGIASDNRPLDSLLIAAPIRVAARVRAGESPTKAKAAGAKRLLRIADTQLADAARAADSVVIATAEATRQPERALATQRSSAEAKARAERIRRALVTTMLSPAREADIARRLAAKGAAAKPDPVTDAMRDESPRVSKGRALGVSVGYVRMIVPPSCRDCVVLAGRWYRWNQGFDRHPNCDCRHIPAIEAMAGDVTINPQDYFDLLSKADQAKYFGKANSEAIREGADISQIVNQTRTKGSIVTADDGRRYTTEGTTKRSLASHQRKRRGDDPMVARPTVWQIYRDAQGDREAAKAMLAEFGYILT